MIIEMTSAGPAFCDAAVPVSTKIPVPMIEPMPSAVRCHGPSDRRSRPPSASACRSLSDFLESRPMGESVAQATPWRLARSKRDGIGLTRLQREAVLGRGQAGIALEQPREVTLIAE